jgi:hypothetical protein
MDIEFIETLVRTIRNYEYLNAIANLHTLQITTAPAKPFSSLLYREQPSSSDGF